MVQIKTKAQTPAGLVDAFDIPIEASTERAIEVELEDGSRVRIRTIPQNVLRLVGHYDNDGNPIYVANVTNVMSLVFVPQGLRRPAILLDSSTTLITQHGEPIDMGGPRN